MYCSLGPHNQGGFHALYQETLPGFRAHFGFGVHVFTIPDPLPTRIYIERLPTDRIRAGELRCSGSCAAFGMSSHLLPGVLHNSLSVNFV